MKIQYALILILFIAACRRSGDMRDDKNMNDTLVVTTPNSDMDGNMRDYVVYDSPEKNAYAEFSLTNGPTVLRVRDWKKNMNLPGLGAANDTLTRELTLSSDKHKGSTITEYKYDDVNLEFFTPKGSAESWLKKAEIKGGPWATARGIKVGDSVADLKSMYPSATQNDPDKTLYQYNVDDSKLTFAVVDNKVSRIKVEYDIP